MDPVALWESALSSEMTLAEAVYLNHRLWKDPPRTEDMTRNQRLALAIIQATAAKRGLTLPEMLGRSRYPERAEARRQVAWLLIRRFHLDFTRAALIIGLSEGRTSLGYHAIDKRIDSDAKLRRELAEILAAAHDQVCN